MSEKETFWSSWQERLSALRNVPPVLKIVWQSGPGVVTFGILARIVAAVLPIGLTYVAKLIIDIVNNVITKHQPVSTHLWWLVGAEFSLALMTGIVGRMMDYSDALLANKYTRHVSIQVMKHASELDVIAYEDPIFYDRLERARVQATDRLVMIQSIGRLELQVITAVGWSAAVMFFRLVDAAAGSPLCCRRFWAKPTSRSLATPKTFARLRSSGNRLPAPSRGNQGSGEGT